MSADNWTVCPKCKKSLEDLVLSWKTEKDKYEKEMYGKVPLEEYKEKLISLTEKIQMKEEKLEHMEKKSDYEFMTMREDYGLGIVEGYFNIYFRASCSLCDFRYKFEHEEKVL